MDGALITSNPMNKLARELSLEHSDNELVSRAKAGDAAAFEQLIARRQERVFAIAYHILGNADDAADVQQETFVRAWTKLKGFRGEASFTTWLTKIAVNICISQKRRSRPVTGLEDDSAIGYVDAPDCNDRIVNGVVVRQLLAEIPAKHRTLLVLREIEGMSIAEVADATGGSVDAVRKQLWRIRKQFGSLLRQRLMEDE